LIVQISIIVLLVQKVEIISSTFKRTKNITRGDPALGSQK